MARTSEPWHVAGTDFDIAWFDDRHEGEVLVCLTCDANLGSEFQDEHEILQTILSHTH